ncbi:MAG: PIG-L family deacetylase [Planctomycetes bacterium]|nr:PIG-L family deacetylase [Planctomycetota bacterium]
MEPYLDPPPLPTPLAAPPARGRVVVVAPHPDDELIGPGGTLLLHRQLGDPLHVVVVTDGGNGGAAASAEQRAALVATRAAESRSVAARLGATLELYGFPDGRRAREEDLGALVPRLVETLARERPALVYAPHPAELHGDHHVVAIATQRALALSGCGAELFGYEVWGACAPDVVVDVSATFAEKVELSRLYASQLGETAIAHCFGGLNAYRSAFLPKGARHGEAFVRLAADAHAR